MQSATLSPSNKADLRWLIKFDAVLVLIVAAVWFLAIPAWIADHQRAPSTVEVVEFESRG